MVSKTTSGWVSVHAGLVEKGQEILVRHLVEAVDDELGEAREEPHHGPARPAGLALPADGRLFEARLYRFDKVFGGPFLEEWRLGGHSDCPRSR